MSPSLNTHMQPTRPFANACHTNAREYMVKKLYHLLYIITHIQTNTLHPPNHICHKGFHVCPFAYILYHSITWTVPPAAGSCLKQSKRCSGSIYALTLWYSIALHHVLVRTLYSSVGLWVHGLEQTFNVQKHFRRKRFGKVLYMRHRLKVEQVKWLSG
jgi:hypothetical protein